MRGLDYAGLMRAALTPPALGGLGLLPVQFWALTPIEVQLMLGREGQPVMNGARLAELVMMYPDHKKDKKHDASV